MDSCVAKPPYPHNLHHQAAGGASGPVLSGSLTAWRKRGTGQCKSRKSPSLGAVSDDYAGGGPAEEAP